MKYVIISLLLLSVLVTSSITFDEAFAESGDISLNLSPPTLEFIQTDYIHNEMIPAKCISDDPKPTNSITWIIIDADTERPYLFSTVNGSAEYSFKAWFPEGDYKIKCKTNFVGGHNESEWKSFSIVSGIVDFAQYKKTKALITYDPPTIIFDERDYTQDETITATCIPDDSKDTTNIIWFIILKGDKPTQFKYPHESETFSFLAGDYEVGNYTIKCRTNFGDGHTKSIDGKFSISVPVVINDVNINYNPITHDVLVDWNFGVQDDRTCYSKTNLGIDYRYEKGKPNQHSHHTFFGTDITLYDVDNMFETDIVNEDMALISCEGDFTFNITDFQLLSNFSGFQFLMSFYEKINDTPHILNEVVMVYSEHEILTNYPCFESPDTLYTEIYYDIQKDWKISGVDVATKQCNSSAKKYNGVIPVVYTPVGSITYEDYPPHNTTNPQSTHNTHNVHNIHKKSAGACSDCTAPNVLSKELIQHTETGKPNTISVSSWEEKGPYYVQLIEIGLGVKDDTAIENSQARIQVWMGYWLNHPDTPNVKKVNVIDPDGILESATATVTLNDECKKLKPCLDTQFHYTYTKKPIHDGMITVVSDFYKNTATNYYSSIN